CHGTFSCTVRYTVSRKRLIAKVYVIPKGNAYIGELILGSGFEYPNSRGRCTATVKIRKKETKASIFLQNICLIDKISVISQKICDFKTKIL
ncbi:hypothetical protein, partial [Sporosarcina sp.]|uniref:hypothetical protein n=1 Tax=Sporosarcina sp. TaxID=49982 RepID=UPI0026299198